jgi:hypothetical protein
MPRRFNPPPNWPPPPPGFTPPPGWQPDPTLPAPPPGWQLWIEDRSPWQRFLAIIGRIYLGPATTAVPRKVVRAGLLGLLTISLIAAPFSQDTSNVPDEIVPTEASTATSAITPPPTPTTATPTTATRTTPPPTTRSTVVPRPVPPPTTRPAPRTTQPPAPAPTRPANCDPHYPTVCIPPPPPDLDCGDIPFTDFTVLAPDPHNFDGTDNDGIGCET